MSTPILTLAIFIYYFSRPRTPSRKIDDVVYALLPLFCASSGIGHIRTNRCDRRDNIYR